MQATKGRANPKIVSEILFETLNDINKKPKIIDKDLEKLTTELDNIRNKIIYISNNDKMDFKKITPQNIKAYQKQLSRLTELYMLVNGPKW